jgi:hypothetical protein
MGDIQGGEMSWDGLKATLIGGLYAEYPDFEHS